MKKIILASTSPRRKEIFEKAGIPFEFEASDFEEDMSLNLPPVELAKQLSLGKAKAVAEKYHDAIVIGADTFIALNGKVLGKPKTEEKAREMLNVMSGRSHSVFTGYTIIDTKTGKTVSKVIETKVFFKELSKDEIDGYIQSGEPLDRAGSYAIQELGAIFVEKIEGDFFNVMGLPLCALIEDLKSFGVDVWNISN